MSSNILKADNGVSSGTTGLVYTAGNDGTLQLATTTSGGTATTAITIDNSQNVGIGVTPSAWATTTAVTAFQLPNGSLSTFSNAYAFSNIYMSANAYLNNSGVWIYTKTNSASLYSQTNGTHSWYYAVSGTAGTSINSGTWNSAMTLDNSGNLLVGTTSAVGKLTVAGNTVSGSTYSLSVANASYTLIQCRDDGYVFLPSVAGKTTGSAANVYIDSSNGNLYRSTSSLKYKTNIQDAVHGLSDLLKLRAVTYQGKSEADTGKTFGGLIAEEVHTAGLTEFVQYANDGTPDALAYGNMVSLCIKAIQELSAEVTALKAKLGV